eukprot:TRINITY_DN8575_c0_g1_i1.p1 TRINITY_DN8575_c0_g1~~TRINITY_DN8575_c0_g1_i1.p1  ORF type:complete len:1164 (+),score=185.84 TRINITY_DN8575_c0_g1_i1:112-3603(+)
MRPPEESRVGRGSAAEYRALDDLAGGTVTVRHGSRSQGCMTIALIVAFGFAAAVYVILFTELGYGATLFKALAKSTRAYHVAGGGVLMLLLLYVVDVSYWTCDAYAEEKLDDALGQRLESVIRQDYFKHFASWLSSRSLSDREAVEREWGRNASESFRRTVLEAAQLERSPIDSTKGCVARVARFALVFAGFCTVLLGGLLAFKDFPYMPLVVWGMLVPCFGAVLKARCFPDCPMADFLIPLGVACLCVGLIWLATATGWVIYMDLLWSDETRCDFAARLRDCANDSLPLYSDREEAAEAAVKVIPLTAAPTGSPQTPPPTVDRLLEVGTPAPTRRSTLAPSRGFSSWTFADYCAVNRTSGSARGAGYCWQYGDRGRACLPGCEEVAQDTACPHDNSYCLAAFLLWGAQFMLSLAVLLFGILIIVVGRVLTTGDQGEKLRVLAYVFIAMFMVMWIAASIAGASMELASVLQAMAGVGLIILAVVVGSSVGWSSLKEHAKKQPLLKKVAEWANSEAVKGLIVLLIWPLLLFFFFLSWLNQRARLFLPCAKKLSPGEEALAFTKRGTQLYKHLCSWHWAHVLRYLVLWGIAFYVVRVIAGKIVILFFSWLNESLKSTPLPVVTLIFVAVGLGMFLLPPVPGIPVYLTGGILLGKIGTEALGSFTWAVTYAVVVTFLLKGLAISTQQKLIGERMSERLEVRSFVGVNSMQIRAIRYILNQDGITRDKVAILIGGPDWPTSVLTGILRLNVFQMLRGSCPIIVPLGLTVMAGASLEKAKDSATWQALASMLQVLTGLAQALSTFAAVAAIERTVHEHANEILADPPDDLEVKALDDKLRLESAALRLATAWHRIPVFWCAVLLIAAAAGEAAFMLHFLRNSGESKWYCYENIEVGKPPKEPPLNGNWLKMVKSPLGWVGIGLLAASYLLYYFFRRWSVREAQVLQGELDRLYQMRAEGDPSAAELESFIVKRLHVPDQGIEYYCKEKSRLEQGLDMNTEAVPFHPPQWGPNECSVRSSRPVPPCNLGPALQQPLVDSQFCGPSALQSRPLVEDPDPMNAPSAEPQRSAPVSVLSHGESCAPLAAVPLAGSPNPAASANGSVSAPAIGELVSQPVLLGRLPGAHGPVSPFSPEPRCPLQKPSQGEWSTSSGRSRGVLGVPRRISVALL